MDATVLTGEHMFGFAQPTLYSHKIDLQTYLRLYTYIYAVIITHSD